MKRLLAKLLGGRPMVREGCAFIDSVAHREVHYWHDTLGHRWMADGQWSLFRVEVSLTPRSGGRQQWVIDRRC